MGCTEDPLGALDFSNAVNRADTKGPPTSHNLIEMLRKIQHKDYKYIVMLKRKNWNSQESDKTGTSKPTQGAETYCGGLHELGVGL